MVGLRNDIDDYYKEIVELIEVYNRRFAMAQQLQSVYTLTPNQYSDDCPILIEAGELLKDPNSGDIIAKVKMRNIGENPILSCKISLKAYENNGDEVEGVSDFPYLDLNAAQGKAFGSDVLVPLPDKTARRFTVDVNEIVFSDGTVKKLNCDQWKTIPKQRSLVDYFNDPELVKQYNNEVGGSAEYMPEKKEGFFLCACGAVNYDSAEKCHNCGRSYDSLIQKLDKDSLINTVSQAKTKNKKLLRIGVICAAVALALIAIICVGIDRKNAAIEDDVYASLAGKRFTKTIPQVMYMYHDFEDDGSVYVNSLDINADTAGTWYRYGIKRFGINTYGIDIQDTDEELFADGKYEYVVTKIEGTQIVEYEAKETGFDYPFILDLDE